MKLNLTEIDTLLYCLSFMKTHHNETIKMCTPEFHSFQKTMENRLVTIESLIQKVSKESVHALADELNKKQSTENV
jgi:hypothetical protein